MPDPRKLSSYPVETTVNHVVALKAGANCIISTEDFKAQIFPAVAKRMFYVVDGDSLTGDDGLAGTSNWFNFLCAQLDNALVIGKNWARAGKSLAQCNSFYDVAGAPSFVIGGGHQFSPAVTGGTGIYFIFAGTNDLGGAPLAADLYVNLTQLVVKAKVDGYAKVVIFTIPARTIIEGGGFGAASETQRLAFNILIRANTAGADYIVDLAAIYTNSLSPEYADGLHFTPAGQRRIATVARATLNDLHPAPHIAAVGFPGDASLGKVMSAEFPGQAITGADGNSFVIAHLGGSGSQGIVMPNSVYFFSDRIEVDGAIFNNSGILKLWGQLWMGVEGHDGPRIIFGTGSPESAVTAPKGSHY